MNVVKLDIEGGAEWRPDMVKRIQSIIAEYHSDSIDYPNAIERIAAPTSAIGLL